MRKIQITREKLELLAVIVILVCGLSVFTLKFGSKATLTYEGGKINYTGYVLNHQGKLTYPNGDVYEGHFVNGIFNGHGRFKSSMGWSYVGEFKKGQADGHGKLTAKDKKIYKGTFKQGIYQK